jgi:hypothetical protein
VSAVAAGVREPVAEAGSCHRIALAVEDLDAATQWFQDMLGAVMMPVEEQAHTATGSKQMRHFIRASFDNVPDARFEYVGHVNTDTDFAVEWVMHPMNVRGVSIGKLRDGKICEQRDYWNGAAFKVPNT